MTQVYTTRILEKSDLTLILNWRNHPKIRNFMLTQHEISMDEHLCWFEKVQHDSNSQQLLFERDGDPFGYVQFKGVQPDGITDWGFYVSPVAPPGAGTELGKLALDYAFSQLRVHKVCGQALDFNAASIALHRRLGFTQEGDLREQYYIQGAYCSLICFGLISHEWNG
tara:strand:+ start:2987 stop:3490 length:504 start_codon:yes stop_codon:yes gene_type:complete